jgi:insertion element IS1 protein InsB
MECEVRHGGGMQRYTLRNRQALAQHQAINKLARKTNHIERFNNTLRQRVSRLMREALSFSKKLANHIGAIKLIICHYNLTRAAV